MSIPTLFARQARQLSVWAMRHPRQAQIAIALASIVLFFMALWHGGQLFRAGVCFSLKGVFLAAGVSIGLCLLGIVVHNRRNLRRLLTIIYASAYVAGMMGANIGAQHIVQQTMQESQSQTKPASPFMAVSAHSMQKRPPFFVRMVQKWLHRPEPKWRAAIDSLAVAIMLGLVSAGLGVASCNILCAGYYVLGWIVAGLSALVALFFVCFALITLFFLVGAIVLIFQKKVPIPRAALGFFLVFMFGSWSQNAFAQVQKGQLWAGAQGNFVLNNAQYATSDNYQQRIFVGASYCPTNHFLMGGNGGWTRESFSQFRNVGGALAYVPQEVLRFSANTVWLEANATNFTMLGKRLALCLQFGAKLGYRHVVFASQDTTPFQTWGSLANTAPPERYTAMNNRLFCYEIIIRPGIVVFVTPSLGIMFSPGDFASVGNLTSTAQDVRFNYTEIFTDGEPDFGVYIRHARTRVSPRGAEIGILIRLHQQ